MGDAGNVMEAGGGVQVGSGVGSGVAVAAVGSDRRRVMQSGARDARRVKGMGRR